jgi:ATP:corrinoid adenosyltransferase
MARQTVINLSDTINTFRVKSNTIAAHIGDLDDLSSDYAGHDSSIVKALNFSKAVRRNYNAGNGILKTSVNGNLTGDSSGTFSVAGGHGLTQEVSGLKLEDMPANTVKVRDAGTTGASSNKEVTDQQILIGDGTGFTSAALSQDVLMTNAGVVTIQEHAVTYDKMQDIVTANRVLGKTTAGTVEEVQIQTDMISDDQVTNDKLANMPAQTMKVNATGAAADPQDLALGNNTIVGRLGSGVISTLSVGTSTVIGRTTSGDIIAAQTATDQIADDAVTNDKLANMPANSVKVGNSSSAADPSDITVADTQILIGNGSGFTTAALSGHVTMANTGACTVSGGEADFVKVDEKNDDVNYQVLFSDNNGTGYQRPYIDTDDGHLMYNPSTQTLSSGTIAGNATTANFADLAEKYTTSEEHPVGTVMMASFNKTEETAPCTSSGIPVGVISEKPAYLMNANAPGQALGLKGRVPVRVVGGVHKGDPVYTHHNGCASKEFNGAMMVGVALESSTVDEEKLIECILKV